MRLVLDASVAVAAARPAEPAHAVSRARVERALQGLDELVLPSLFALEVTGALARLGFARALVREFVEPPCVSPHEIVTLGPRRAARAARIASSCKLRGADALYVWLAVREAIPLCTLDHEMRTRAPATVKIVDP